MSSSPIIAVSEAELRVFGCPSCQCMEGTAEVRNASTAVWVCSTCGRKTHALVSGVTTSTISTGAGGYYPPLEPHPRKPPTITPVWSYGGG